MWALSGPPPPESQAGSEAVAEAPLSPCVLSWTAECGSGASGGLGSPAPSDSHPLPQQLLGMLLSVCLCRHIHSEDYSKVPKY